MSFFVYCDTTVEKRMFTQKEHQSVIRKLQRGEVEQTMRSLLIYKLDKNLNETEVIMFIIRSLCDETALGRIVEYAYRQIMNETEGFKMQPIEYPRKPVIVKEKPSVSIFNYQCS